MADVGVMLLAEHLVARTRFGDRSLLQHSKASWLWSHISRVFPDAASLVLMPDHLHLLSRGRVDGPLGDALRAYAQWRNHQRGDVGPLFERQPEPTEVVGEQKLWRNLRGISSGDGRVAKRPELTPVAVAGDRR